MRVGMLGGAFDPPHAAHRAMAEHAVAQWQLDVLHVVPTGLAWHKARPLTPAHHRLAMCALAFADVPKVHLDDREIRRGGPSYTLDTLRELRTQYPSAELLLVMGQDQWDALPSWNDWQAIADMASLVVAARPSDHATPDAAPLTLQMEGVHAQRLHMPLVPISATALRHWWQQAGEHSQALPPPALVDSAVARYISAHYLYETTP